MLKNRKGVTYIELLLTVVAVIVLAVISFRLYGYNIERSVAVEGAETLRRIADAEMVYRLENKTWANFEDLTLKLEGELLDSKTFKKDNFVFDIDFDENSDVKIRARRYYNEGEITSGNKSYWLVASVAKIPADNGRFYDVYARADDSATGKEKTVVNYINKKFGGKGD